MLGYISWLYVTLCPTQEQPDKPEELDDDEDRKNPAYIPRKGAFYEHDTRIDEEDGETATTEEAANERNTEDAK